MRTWNYIRLAKLLTGARLDCSVEIKLMPAAVRRAEFLDV